LIIRRSRQGRERIVHPTIEVAREIVAWMGQTKKVLMVSMTRICLGNKSEDEDQ
jgi:hypothetical protein